MAIMIPGSVDSEEFNGSGGELRLWECLKKLPDTYRVFHSLRWNQRLARNQYSNRIYLDWREADFTIFHPELGILVVEVKGGLISYRRDTGWVQTNRRTGTEKIVDPLDQAKKSMFFFRDLIREKYGSLPYSLCSAVWFTDADRTCVEGELPPSYQEDIVLWSNHLSTPESAEMAIRSVYRFHDANSVSPDEALTQKIINILAPEFNCFQSIRGRAMASKALFHRMTKEQSYLLDYLDEQECAAIHGVAGTGKTVLAVEKAHRLAEHDRVLFLCFNRLLKEHLEATSAHPNIFYNNLMSLYRKKTSRPLPKDTVERDNAIFDFLMDWQSYSWEYKHIIIDEGQDFKDDHLQALHEIAEATEGCFYVFYDRNQFVQGLEYPQWLDRIDCRLVLSRNCRNTKEIAVTSTRPIGIAEEKIRMRRDDIAGQDGVPPKPNFYLADDLAQLKETLLKILMKYTKAGIPKERIVVLSCKSDGISILPVGSDERLTLNPHYVLSKRQEAKTILFTTVRKFKGLEADVVICIDIDGNTFANDKEKNVFYVGTSRATTYLEMISIASPSELALSLTGDADLPKPQCISVIRDQLRVRIGSSRDFDSLRI